MNQPVFGKELMKIRKAKGLTQSELAEKYVALCVVQINQPEVRI